MSVPIARMCHELNKAYCHSISDDSQPHWEDAPQWQRDSAVAGVEFLIANPEAQAGATHESWSKVKEADGWVYGEKKDPEAKTHPCLVPFDKLPTEQQMKDKLFIAVVRTMTAV